MDISSIPVGYDAVSVTTLSPGHPAMMTTADVEAALVAPRYGRGRRIALRELLLVTAWVELLPPDGFDGTPSELLDSLFEVGRAFNLLAFVPMRGGARLLASYGDVLAEHGWELRESRTRTERRVRVAPVTVPVTN
jgi:hypothetical protein